MSKLHHKDPIFLIPDYRNIATQACLLHMALAGEKKVVGTSKDLLRLIAPNGEDETIAEAVLGVSLAS